MKTVDKVISKFTKLVDELDTVAKQNETRAADYSEQIDYLTGRRKACRREIQRANTIRNNITNLIGE